MGHHALHGHLRLASAPAPDAPAASRLWLRARAVAARVGVFVLNLVALCGVVLALAPLLLRRRPVGHRTQVPRPAARVIPLPPRRRASPP